jgi:hypothetical protein
MFGIVGAIVAYGWARIQALFSLGLFFVFLSWLGLFIFSMSTLSEVAVINNVTYYKVYRSPTSEWVYAKPVTIDSQVVYTVKE